MSTGTHVVVVLDQAGGWADVLGPFPSRGEAGAFRRQLVRQTGRRSYFGLTPGAVVVTPLLSAQAYQHARAAIREELPA
jgi:hypothetical protein